MRTTLKWTRKIALKTLFFFGLASKQAKFLPNFDGNKVAKISVRRIRFFFFFFWTFVITKLLITIINWLISGIWNKSGPQNKFCKFACKHFSISQLQEPLINELFSLLFSFLSSIYYSTYADRAYADPYIAAASGIGPVPGYGASICWLLFKEKVSIDLKNFFHSC